MKGAARETRGAPRTGPLHGVQAVLLDAAGTLLRVEPSVGHIYAGEAARFGFTVAGDTLDKLFQREWQRHRPHEGHGTPFHTSEAVERAWWRTLVHNVMQGAGAPKAFRTQFDAFFDVLYERFAQPEVWRLYDDVLPTLDILAERGIRLAVLSNWDSRLPRLLQAMSMTDRFAFVLTSAEAGVSKPHPEIYRAALTRLALPAHSVVHVGDSLEEDVWGARAAGLHSLLLDRRDGALRGSDTITSLAGLPPLIAP